MTTQNVTESIKTHAHRIVPVVSYGITLSMIFAAALMLAGSAFVAILFGETTLAGFGFLGATIVGGQGLLGFLRQLNQSYGSQMVTFQADQGRRL